MRILVPLVLALALTGCQAQAPSTTQTAAAPKLIQSLTNETLVYSCPDCGMDFDAAGQCSMCKVDLVATQVAYVCPEDNEAVGQAGKCPRCDMNAKVVKTAVAAAPAEPAEEPATTTGS